MHTITSITPHACLTYLHMSFIPHPLIFIISTCMKPHACGHVHSIPIYHSCMHARHTHFLLIPVIDSRYHHHAHNSISFFHRFPCPIPSLATHSLYTHHYSHSCSTESIMKVVSCLSINNAVFIAFSFPF